MNDTFSQRIENLILPLINELGAELYSLKYSKEGKNYFLRVYIYKMDQEIDIDDCTRVSEAVSNALDESDLIKHAYFLEVASPGAERQLRNEKELLSAMGKELLISLKEPIENNDTIEGKLLRFVDNIITIQSGEQIIEVPFLDTKKIRLKIQF